MDTCERAPAKLELTLKVRYIGCHIGTLTIACAHRWSRSSGRYLIQVWLENFSCILSVCLSTQCNAMHRAMYCTECFFQVWIGIGVWACESWMKLKLEAGSAAGARLLLWKDMELEQKQENQHHHRPMYEAESAWDLDIDEKTSPGGTYIPGMEQDYIISSLMPTSCKQAWHSTRR